MTTSFTGFGSTAGFTGAGSGSGGGANTQFPTYAAAKAASIPAATNYVTTMGYYAPGDGGRSTYKRSTALLPYDPGFVSSHDGSIWSLVPEKPLHTAQFGIVGDGVTDNAAAVWQMTAYLPFVAETSQILSNVTLSIGNPCIVQPIPGSPPPYPHQLHTDQLVEFSTTGKLPDGVVAGQLYYIQYGSVTVDTFQISATSGMFYPAYIPTADYTLQRAKGVPVGTTGTQSGTHTMTVHGDVWTDIVVDPGVYVANLSTSLCLGLDSGIRKLRIIGYGATLLSQLNNSWSWQTNWYQDNNRLTPLGFPAYAPQSKFLTTAISAGNIPISASVNTITLVTIAEAANFRINSWVRIEALELQGGNGYSNPYYVEYQRIKSIDLTTGIITLWGYLKYQYRSTYPSFFNNHGTEWPGIYFGPATICQMPDLWDVEVEIRGPLLSNSQTNLESPFSAVRSMRLVDCTISSPAFSYLGGPVPAINQLWVAEHCRWLNTVMEIDKSIETMKFNDCEFDEGSYLRIQSPINELIIDRCIMRGSLGGTAKSTVIRDSWISGGFGLTVGPVFGTTERLTIENSYIELLQLALQQQERNVVTDFSSFSAGTLVVNAGQVTQNFGTYTGAGTSCTNPCLWAVPGNKVFFISPVPLRDPASVVRASNTANALGAPFTVTNVYNGGPGTLTGTAYCIDTTLTSLPTSTFTFTASVAGTAMTVTALSPSNAVLVADVYTITGTGLPAGTKISTGPGWLSGVATGVYTLNQNGGTLGSRTFTATMAPMQFLPNPSPRTTIINSSGCQQIKDMSDGPAGIPLYSYFNRSFYGFNNAGGNYYPQNSIQLMGNLMSWTINVTKAYTGAAGTMNLTFSMFGFINSSNNLIPTCLVQVVNLMTAGVRTITAATTTGGVAGDTLTACPYWLTGAHTINWTAAAGGDTIDVMAHFTMTAQTDQGTGAPIMSVGDGISNFDIVSDGYPGQVISA